MVVDSLSSSGSEIHTLRGTKEELDYTVWWAVEWEKSDGLNRSGSVQNSVTA